jgi:hypothetical protein
LARITEGALMGPFGVGPEVGYLGGLYGGGEGLPPIDGPLREAAARREDFCDKGL